MATSDTNKPSVAEGTSFCVDCGSKLAPGRFCPGCGRPVSLPEDGPFPRHEAATERAADFVGATGAPATAPGTPHERGATTQRMPLLDEVQAVGSLQPPPSGNGFATRSRRSRWPIYAVCGVFSVAVAATAIIVLTGSSGNANGDSSAKYARKVAAAFVPVDAANRRLSNRLAALDSRRTTAAKAAVAQAQSATSSARGALGALTVPDGSRDLNGQLRQALDREDTYLSAIALALSDPTSPAVSQVQSLAGNLTSALEAVGGPIPDASRSVTGADALTSWAQRTRRATARRQRAKRSQHSGSASQGAAPSALADGRDCGSGLHAGPNTTCEFAQNVRDAWGAAPGLANTIEVYSPVTDRTYTMSCAPAGSGIACSGGNDASVSW